MSRHFFVLVAVLAAFIAGSNAAPNKTKIKMDVHYETLCPDSIRFVKKLYENYEKISDMVDVHLLPFGKASWDRSGENLNFHCQHGPKECLGNQIHACALAKLDFDVAFEFVHCSERDLWHARRPNVTEYMENCAKKQSLNFESINKCAESDQGKQHLLEVGKQTKSLHPRLDFVPTVVFNNQYSRQNQRTALYGDLVELVEKLHEQSKSE